MSVCSKLRSHPEQSRQANIHHSLQPGTSTAKSTASDPCTRVSHSCIIITGGIGIGQLQTFGLLPRMRGVLMSAHSIESLLVPSRIFLTETVSNRSQGRISRCADACSTHVRALTNIRGWTRGLKDRLDQGKKAKSFLRAVELAKEQLREPVVRHVSA